MILQNMITFRKIQLVKVMITQLGVYKTYFKRYYKLITIDLRKQQKLDAAWKTIQQINFNGHLKQDGDTQMFFIIEEAKAKPF